MEKETERELWDRFMETLKRVEANNVKIGEQLIKSPECTHDWLFAKTISKNTTVKGGTEFSYVDSEFGSRYVCSKCPEVKEVY